MRASQLRPGDVLASSGAIVHRVVRDGLYKRDSADRVIRGCPFPRGYVEVLVQYPGSAPRVDYWRASTSVKIKEG